MIICRIRQIGNAVLIALLMPASFVCAQSNKPINFQPTRFISTSGEVADAETGWVIVRETHANPQSPTIKLPVVRFKTLATKPGNPIIYLAGGPGASGLLSAKEEIFPLLMALRQRSDVIVFDQRGTGRAEPSLNISGRTAMPADATLDEDASRLYVTEKAKAAAAEIASRGINLSSYNTAENADDVEDLRKALGAEKLTVWGHSYGTHLALAFIKRYPGSVDRAILGSINGLDQRWRYPSNLDDLIDRVDSYIKLDQRLKRQMPSLRQAVSTVFSRLEKNPVNVRLNGNAVKIGKLEVQTLVALRSGDLEFVKMLPMLFGQMQDGDYGFTAQMVNAAIKQRDWGTAMRFSMHIASGVSSERSNEIEKQEGKTLFGRGMNYPYSEKEFLAAWNVKDLGGEFRAPFKSDVPALFLSATLDGRTSLPDAAIVRQQFTNSQQIVVEGASHNFYHLSPQVLAAMSDFLDGKKVPEKISVAFELRAANERKLFLELKKIIAENGVEAAIKKAREWNGTQSEQYLSSYIFGNLGVTLLNDDKKPKEAMDIFKLGLEIFPDNLFLTERLGDSFEANGMIAEAIAQYERCLKLNPMNRRPAVKLAELTKAK